MNIALQNFGCNLNFLEIIKYPQENTFWPIQWLANEIVRYKNYSISYIDHDKDLKICKVSRTTDRLQLDAVHVFKNLKKVKGPNF